VLTLSRLLSEFYKHLYYNNITFTTGGSFNTTFEMLAGQALKAIFKLKSNLLNKSRNNSTA